MLDCLTAHAHRLGCLLETLLHRFEYVLVFPSRDSPLGSCRTPGFERAARACRRPVAAQRLAVLLVRTTIGQLLARRAAIDILSRQINEILLAETAIRLRARCHRLRQRRRNVSLLACQNLGAVEVAAIRNRIQMVSPKNFLSLAMRSWQVVSDPSRYSSPRA